MAKQTKYHLEIKIDKLTNSIVNSISGVKEPQGVDFIVDPTPLTNEDRKRISEIIAYYKATGKKLPFAKSKVKSRGQGKHIQLTKSIKHVL